MADLVRLWISYLGPLIFLPQKTFKIIWISYLLTLSVPDQGHSRNVPDQGHSRNASGALNYISTFLLDIY